jgi:hypothetical protein
LYRLGYSDAVLTAVINAASLARVDLDPATLFRCGSPRTHLT